jgi:phenylacetate-CoA ligase
MCKKLLKDEINFSPKAIFTSGEILTSEMRNVIKKCFKAPVYDHYSASEFDYIAWQCKEKDLYHINIDAVILESIPSENLSGYGEAVITNLFNYLMPLIRYKVGDIVKLKDENYSCKCKRGLPLMERIGGRTSKVIRLNSGKTFVPYEVIDSLASIKELKKFRIIYKGQNRFLLKAKIDNNLNLVSNRVKEHLKRLFKENIEIAIERVSNISKERSGKVNLLIIEE